MKVNSEYLKTAVMAFFRFKRRNICADEVRICTRHLADILIDNNKQVIEVEIKTSKSDLRADKKKSKHLWYIEKPETYAPNLFYICVPSELVEDAIKWCEEINPNYGVIEFSQKKFESYYRNNRRWDEMLYFVKKAKPLHKIYKSKKDRISLRLCSANINFKLGDIYGSKEWCEIERQKTLGQVGDVISGKGNVDQKDHS